MAAGAASSVYGNSHTHTHVQPTLLYHFVQLNPQFIALFLL